MQISENGINKIVEWEGFKNHVYKDSAGLPTIGVGHLLTKDELASGKISILGRQVKYRAGLSDEDVKSLLKQDITTREKVVSSLVKVSLSQNQFDALVSFVFNVGSMAFQNSTLLKVLNAGRYNDVPAQLMRWVYAGGEKIAGLVNRRSNEVKLWNEESSEVKKKPLIDVNIDATSLDWLMKRNSIKIKGVNAVGQNVNIKYDHDKQCFTIEV